MSNQVDQPDGVHDRLQDRLLIAVGDRTNRRVGEMTNTHPETVRRYLSGHAPSVDFVSRLAHALGLNLNWILTGRGPMRVAEIKPRALKEANATDLLTHVALAIETIESKVDRLERYTQVLEIMIRQAQSGHSADVELKPSGEATHDHAATTQASGDEKDRAWSIADAVARRPCADAGGDAQTGRR